MYSAYLPRRPLLSSDALLASARVTPTGIRFQAFYPDKARLIDKLIKLCEADEYGVRGDLIDAVHKFLSKDMLRVFADQLRKKIRGQADAYRWSRALASIARQLKDAPMYEEALRMTRHGLHPRLYPDVARA